MEQSSAVSAVTVGHRPNNTESPHAHHIARIRDGWPCRVGEVPYGRGDVDEGAATAAVESLKRVTPAASVVSVGHQSKPRKAHMHITATGTISGGDGDDGGDDDGDVELGQGSARLDAAPPCSAEAKD